MDLSYHLDISRDRCDSIFNDDWAFFANLYWKPLREELTTLDHSSRKTSVTLSLARSGCWEALWIDQAHEGKIRIHKDYTSL